MQGGSQGSDGLRINESIRVPKIRLIDQNGEMIGVVNVREGLERAADAGLDLVEISPQADPPVCKLLDYGKYRFELQKKKAAERKKQKVVEVKEVKLRPNIEENDLHTKMRNVKRFIEEGNKVKLTMQFRGREMSHQEFGLEVLKKVADEMGEAIKVELQPKLEGRQMIMVIAPK
ncbi:MAG: translation initiation factor IF-3 [Holosporales bacterium]